jgi:thiosulfate dehydrogenase
MPEEFFQQDTEAMHFSSKLAGLMLLAGLTIHPVGATPPEKLAAEGDPERGIKACADCHQPNGGGSESVGAPRLAAMGSTYLANQIRHFRDGNRNHPIMQEWAKLVTDAEIDTLAEHYAAMPPASNAEPPADQDPDLGKWIALYGDWGERRLPACVQCHGPLGIGVGKHFPALAGQPYNYLLGQLAAWYKDERTGDPLGMMDAMTDKLSVAEARSVAAFYASLPAQKAVDVAADIAEGEVVPDAAEMTAPSKAGKSAAADASAPTAATGPLPHHGEVPAGRQVDAAGYFTPPARDAKPEAELGEMVALGEAIFSNTYSHQISGKYVGNDQACEGCHLDAGRLADAAPMWAAWVSYPAYRKKNKKVNTLIERVQGCFDYSMNAQASEVGSAPAADSQTLHALVSYMYWLATDAPTGDAQMPGRGYPDVAEPAQGFDPERGAEVFAAKCAVCHGENGEGGYAGDEMVFPPLWGERSYNWGAGMHKVNTAAGYIKANMPLGNFLTLTDQEAWDVAAFVNSHERPQDPRFDGDLQQTTEQFHKNKYSLYGKREGPDGKLLGESSPTGKR